MVQLFNTFQVVASAPEHQQLTVSGTKGQTVDMLGVQYQMHLPLSSEVIVHRALLLLKSHHL